MIHKVYIVQCSYCYVHLPNPKTSDPHPRYFLHTDNAFLAMSDAGWQAVNGMHICAKCFERTKRSEL